jgi:hypothetical protein
MKWVIVIILLFNAACGLPPTNLKPQEGVNLTTFNFEVPNKQGTKTGGVNSLIETGNKNLLENPSFEHLTFSTGWTFTGTGSLTAEPTIIQSGKKSAKLEMTAQTAKLCQESTINAAQLAGLDMTMSVWIKGDAADGKICPYANGTEITSLCQNISTLNQWNEYVTVFPAGSTSSGLCVEYASTTGTVYIDDAHVGVMPATMTPEVAQAEYFGSAKLVGAASCIWSHTQTSFTSFPANTNCNNWASEGNIKPASTKTPSFTIPAGSPSGEYLVYLNLGLAAPNVDGVAALYRLFDGAAQVGESVQSSSASTFDISISPYYFRFQYSTKTTDTTYTVQSRSSSGQTAIRGCNIPDRTCVFDVYYYPPKNKIYSNKSMGWYVDVNIGGANPSLGTSNVSSYTSISNGSLDMVINPGSQPAQIPCSGTNPSTGITCSAGDEQIGVVFDVPSVGTYEVCAEFQHFIRINAAGSQGVEGTFQFIETPNNAQTILQEGRSRLTSAFANSTAVDNYTIKPQKNCGVFKFDSVGKKTVRLAYEQIVLGAPTANSVLADRNVAVGQRDIHITVKPFINNEQITASFKQIDDELEEVYVRATNTTFSVADSSVSTITGWANLEDTKNAFNASTGVFTAPKTGLYDIKLKLGLSHSASMPLYYELYIQRNDVTTDICIHNSSTTSISVVGQKICNTTLRLSAGQTVRTRIYQVTGGTRSVSANASVNSLVITRIPSK